ncbi:hypothetical protein HYU95_01875 [Candidatus Daviesbacteria bacterium]|nr:hypothetical protein [Candidatus Daviesbacteria bacterium]
MFSEAGSGRNRHDLHPPIIEVTDAFRHQNFLKDLDRSREVTIALYGVNGNLVRRFLVDGFFFGGG